MFKKLTFAIALVATVSLVATSAFARVKPPVKICLHPGSYLFVQTKDDIYRLKMNAGQIVDQTKLTITNPGVSQSKIAVNACDLVYERENPGKGLPDLFHMNPVTGFEQQNITRSPDMAEFDPVMSPDGYRVAFTRYEPDATNVVSVTLDGYSPRIEAPDATSPAWQVNSPVSYTENSDSKIVPWGAYGYIDEFLPDRSGVLVNEFGQDFFIWPVVGLRREFGQFSYVAIRPSGSLAAVVWQDGVGNRYLAFTKLDAKWVPYGNLTFPDTIFSTQDISGLAWIEVK